MKNYKFVIIDGQIESISEVHHLLEKASETKVPYVIFCLGLSSEVENVIKFNNSKHKFEVFPVVIKFSEKTLNFLHDLAIVLNEEVVSATKGQTISGKIRQELKTGKEITFNKRGFSIDSNTSDSKLFIHRKFLRRRINETVDIENKNLLTERLKIFSTKTIKIFIPKQLYSNNDFIRELDYCIRFLSKSNKKMKSIKICNKTILIPEYIIEYADKKILSLDKIYNNVSKLIVWDENDRS